MAMDLLEAISGRRSVRDYTSQRPDDSIIAQLLTAAVNAPSARNGQPWRFTVVRDPELLDRLSTEAKAYQLATLPAGRGNEERRARMADPANHLCTTPRHWSSSRPSSPRPGQWRIAPLPPRT